jgi:hypothetical protein
LETIDLNAPDGLADYCNRYGPLYLDIAKQAEPRAWGPELVGKLDAEQRAALPTAEREARYQWRDRRLMNLIAHKRRAEEEDQK